MGDPSHSRPIWRARARTARVEDPGDLALGVLVEQLIDFGDHGRIGLAQLPGVQRERQLQAVGGAAAESDVSDERVGPQQGDVVQEQTEHALAVALRRGRHR